MNVKFAGNITGALLLQPNEELLALLDNPPALYERAADILRQLTKPMPTPLPAAAAAASATPATASATAHADATSSTPSATN